MTDDVPCTIAPNSKCHDEMTQLAQKFADEFAKTCVNGTDEYAWTYIDGKEWVQAAHVWTNVIRYLELRDLLERCQRNPDLVRVKE